MAKYFPEMLAEHQNFIKKQHLFFIATAPLDAAGHVNLSPKGYDTLRILSSTEIAYLDLTGSGNETSGHINENARITFMFCAFEGSPMILRLYGSGKVILPETEEWDRMIGHFEMMPGARQIILAKIHKVQTSCGYSVPFMTYSNERETLNRSNMKKGEAELENYLREKNSSTIDGILTPLGEKLSNDSKTT
ncbi:pyridoxamine 5'-phosphate oxidase family protein [Peribacillus frigoritolerans]|uniref:pyridoxamine 5'-phosphate oxidase family protein n=1 Tax=Peribacillus frigoritolerans TaxID=450367 RepID=UPI0030088C56